MDWRLSLVVVVIAFTTGPSCATPAPSTDASSEPPIQIIDAHTHTAFSGNASTGFLDTREEFLRRLREANAVGAIAHVLHDGTGYTDLKKEGVIHCAAAAALPDIVEIEAGLKSGKYGCIKIYLGYIHQYAYDPQYKPAYQLAEKYDVPVVFHTGDTYSKSAKIKYADPLTVDEVAVDHPKVRFVIAHLGNPWIASAAEVAYRNANVWLDGSALLTGDMNDIPREKVEEFVVKPVAWAFGYVENPAKLMFGSDWPLSRISTYVEAFKRAIPKEHWKPVFHDNAVRVFKLK